MYVRGTAVVDTLQGSIDSATNAALRELGKKLETRLNSKKMLLYLQLLIYLLTQLNPMVVHK